MSWLNPSVGQAWLLLVLAGLLETAWAVGLKSTEGFTRPLPTAAVLITAWLSFWLLSLAMKALPVGTAYAVWVGIGAVGAALLGILWLGESANALRIASLLAIVAGVVGLKLAHA
jgi:quaternary ammonium compound-resistance protein SugE